jgi:hypothetical protein
VGSRSAPWDLPPLDKPLDSGVDVPALVLGKTDTPTLRRVIAAQGGTYSGLADPEAVAEEALDHLADGPTWISGSANPAGGAPFGALSRRDAVLAMSRGAAATTRGQA